MSTEAKTGLDYEELAKATDQIRELVAVLVAALVADGFTDRESRVVIAGIFAGRVEASEDPS